MVESSSAVEETSLLDPSELGTQAYWEAAYVRELKNNENDADDEGIVWFDESNAEDTVLRQLNTYYEQGLLQRSTARFLDLGSGNGHMLFALIDDEDDDGEVWSGEMVGVDYSPTSVKLARQIQARKMEAHDEDDQDEGHRSGTRLTFEQWDMLTESPGSWLDDGFDVVLDKGTFDAISLMPYTSGTEHPCDIYRRKVVPLMKPNGLFVVTSCNWTAAELIKWLAVPDGELEKLEEARYPTFTFGGKTGQSVVTVVFRRRTA